MMHRRSFLWAVLIGILDACVGPPSVPRAPKGETSPLGSTSPQPLGASPDVSPTAPPGGETLVQTPTPTPTPEMPIVVAAPSGDVVAPVVSDIAPVSPLLSEGGYEFTLSGVDERSSEPLGLSILGQGQASDVRVFVSNASTAAEHDYWVPVTSPQRSVSSVAASRAIPSRNGRYLAITAERTNIPDSVVLVSTNVQNAGLEAIPEFVDEPPVAVSAFRAQYISHAIITPADAVVTGTKDLLVFVHGAGSENREYFHLWENFLAFLKANPAFRDEFLKRFVIVVWRYDSQAAIDSNARAMVSALRAAYGPRVTYFVGHSMGGLLSRCGYADLFKEGLAGGVVTLGTPHNGSPLAVPELMGCTFSTFPYPTLFTVLYQIVVNNFIGGMRSLRLKKRVSDYVTELLKLYSDGFVSLASHEQSFGIPDKEFVTKFSFGPLQGVPLPGILNQGDNLLVPESSSAFAAVSGVKGAIRMRTTDNKARINQVEAIKRYEMVVGCADTPHVFAHAGAIDQKIRESDDDLVARYVRDKGIETVAGDTSVQMQQAALRWISRSIFPLIPTASGKKSAGNDGLVRVEDAFGLEPGADLGADGTVDLAIAAARAPKWVRGVRMRSGYTHLDLAIGKSSSDTEYFTSIAEDVLTLAKDRDSGAVTSVTPEVRDAVIKFIYAYFVGQLRESGLQPVLQLSRTFIDMVPGKTNRVTASFRIHLTDSSNNVVFPRTGYQSYTANLVYLQGRWYFYRSPGYTLGGFLETVE